VICVFSFMRKQERKEMLKPREAGGGITQMCIRAHERKQKRMTNMDEQGRQVDFEAFMHKKISGECEYR